MRDVQTAMIEDVRLSDLIKPTPKQRECIQATDRYRFTLYGGAAGGGKSYMLRWWCLRQLLKRYAETGIKGLRVGLFSVDYPTLSGPANLQDRARVPPNGYERRKPHREGGIVLLCAGGVWWWDD